MKNLIFRGGGVTKKQDIGGNYLKRLVKKREVVFLMGWKTMHEDTEGDRERKKK